MGRRDCRWSPDAASRYGQAELSGQGASEFPCQPLLKREKRWELDFKTVCPDLGLIARRNEPCGHAHPPPVPAHSSFHHVIHAQFLPDLLDALPRVPVVRDRSEGDDPKTFRTQLAEFGDDLIGESVREQSLGRIISEISEGKDGNQEGPRGRGLSF